MKALLLATPLVLAAAGGFYYTPYQAAERMQTAARAHDAAALNKQIDYPAVRESLKTALNDGVSQALLKNKTDSGMNAFARMFAAAFVNPLIDTLVTPDNLALMLQAELPAALTPNQPPADAKTPEPDDLLISRGYADFDHFTVTVAKKTHPDLPFTFTFTRDGLLGWKLTGLVPPRPAA